LLNQTSANSCIVCPTGNYCPLATTNFVNCSAGSFNLLTGKSAQSDCNSCLVGAYCPLASTNVVNCSFGLYNPLRSQRNQSSCIPCPTGRFAPHTGYAACTICMSGHYCPVTGVSAPSICPRGSYCVEGVSVTTICSAGVYGETDGLSAAACTGPAARGYYTIGNSTTAIQVPCNASTYNNVSGGANIGYCIPCVPGFYCPTPATTDYTAFPCASSYYCPISSIVANHSACEPGFYCPPRSGMHIPCPLGTFNPVPLSVDNSSCLACPPNKFCLAEGLDMWISCFQVCMLG
jgi:hypothetical protein